MPPKRKPGETTLQAVLRHTRERRQQRFTPFEPHLVFDTPERQQNRRVVWSLVRPYYLSDAEDCFLEAVRSLQQDEITLNRLTHTYAMVEDTSFDIDPYPDDSQAFLRKLWDKQYEENNAIDKEYARALYTADLIVKKLIQ